MNVATSRGFLDEARYPGLFGWIFSTDHKRIGLLYLWSIVAFFIVGVLLGLLLRLELFSPGETIVTAQTYNALFTLHGVVMIFLFMIPAIPSGFGSVSPPHLPITADSHQLLVFPGEDYVILRNQAPLTQLRHTPGQLEH